MARIAAVILAAGESRRFGQENKLLADVGGAPLVRRVAETVARSVAEILAVTGHDEAGVAAALAGLPVRLHYNPHWERGMGTSVAAGVSALSAEAAAALIVPGDMALLSDGLIEALIAAFDAGAGTQIVYPVTKSGAQRNPVLWPRSYFPHLIALDGGEGAKKLLETFAPACRAVTIGDERVFSDVDTPADLATALARIGGDHS